MGLVSQGSHFCGKYNVPTRELYFLWREVATGKEPGSFLSTCLEKSCISQKNLQTSNYTNITHVHMMLFKKIVSEVLSIEKSCYPDLKVCSFYARAGFLSKSIGLCQRARLLTSDCCN